MIVDMLEILMRLDRFSSLFAIVAGAVLLLLVGMLWQVLTAVRMIRWYLFTQNKTAEEKLVAAVLYKPVPKAMGRVDDYEVMICQLNDAIAGGHPELSGVAVYNSDGRLLLLYPPVKRPFENDISQAVQARLKDG